MLGLNYDDIQWDHIHPKALGGIDDRHNPENWQPLTTAEHKEKTFGKPATTYGSDIHAIAKADRLEARRQHEILSGVLKDREAIRERKARSKWAKRKFIGKRRIK